MLPGDLNAVNIFLMNFRPKFVTDKFHPGNRLSATVEVHVTLAKCYAEMLKLTFITHAFSHEQPFSVVQTAVDCVPRRVPPKEQVGEPTILFEHSIG
jgi:Rad3-related DNA helicase